MVHTFLGTTNLPGQGTVARVILEAEKVRSVDLVEERSLRSDAHERRIDERCSPIPPVVLEHG